MIGEKKVFYGVCAGNNGVNDDNTRDECEKIQMF